MDAGKKTQNKGSGPACSSSTTFMPPLRNLKKGHLAGVIFGCTGITIKECLSKQLFGLPLQHFSYVKNIEPGLALFLFNYSKRELHGIFEAASAGQMNIDPYGWTSDGSQKTSFPAQVQVHVRKKCHPLVENQFAPIIKENYYTNHRFLFELDQAQVNKLISLFSNQVVPAASSVPVNTNTGNWQFVHGHVSFSGPATCLDSVSHSQGAVSEVTAEDETQQIYEKLQKLAVCEQPGSSVTNLVEESADDASPNIETMQMEDFNNNPTLMQEYQELKTFKQENVQKMSQVLQRLADLESEVQLLKNRCMMLESWSNHSETNTYGATLEACSEEHLDPEDMIFIVGGYNEKIWLSSLDSYFPSKDVTKSLKPMSCVRSYASLAKLNGDLFVIGGGNNSVWYDTVECYNPFNNDWTSLPCLNGKKGSLAATTLQDKIFVMGGGNGVDCYSDVEMFDLDVGKWISARSMLQKRFALAAVELNGSIYAVGGFDGKEYLRSAERFDPREHSWRRIESMNSKRGSHSLVALNEQLYAIGGWDGNTVVPTVEVFDPRQGKWMSEAPMNEAKGYSAAVVLHDTVYVIGGVNGTEGIVGKVEKFNVAHGWKMTNLKAIGKRCFASAIIR